MADEAFRVTRFINGKPDRTTAKHVYAKDLTKAVIFSAAEQV